MIRINKHVWLVDYIGFKFPHCNCLLVEDDITCLIDNSSGESGLSMLKKKKIDMIINSHGHLDHYFHNDQFPDSRILMHPADGNMGCTLDDFIHSIQRLLALKPDYLITGHGEGIVKENIAKRLLSYRDIIYARQQRIVNLLKTGRHTLDELARESPIYIRFPKPEILFYLYEKVMILIHLRHLQALDQVFEEGDRYYLK